MPERVVEVKLRPQERVKITLSGGRFFTVPEEQCRSIEVGAVLADAQVARLDRIDQYFRGRDKALRLLALRARTRHELRTALTGMAVSGPVCDGLLSELEEQGLVDDLKFTREYVNVKSEVKLLGPHRLRHDLSKLGVTRAVVDKVLEESLETIEQERMAWRLVERKVGEAAVDEKVVRRMQGLLRRRGFDFDVVGRVTYKLLERSGQGAPEE